MGIKVLSLFDGISCGRVALERANIKVDNYFSSEIDKYAIQIADKNYPQDKKNRLGDVTKWKEWNLPKIDLLIGGSPCQGFSFAGKQLNFGDTRSKLFFEFVEILNYYKPKYFLLENVKMKQEYQDIISDYLGVQPIEINSALVSAQNRVRLYWTNITGIEQPIDKDINLVDVLENDTITNPSAIRGIKLNKATILGRRLNKEGKRDDYNKDVSVTQCLEVRATNTNKSNCLTTVEKDNVLTTLPIGRYPDIYKKSECIQVGEADINGFECIRRVYSIEGKSPTLTTMQGGHREPKIEVEGNYWRPLTVLEMERLQTLPDNYTEGVSNSQRKKMLGNGWTVDVIAHIFKSLKEELR